MGECGGTVIREQKESYKILKTYHSAPILQSVMWVKSLQKTTKHYSRVTAGNGGIVFGFVFFECTKNITLQIGLSVPPQRVPQDPAACCRIWFNL